ncbi:MAG TPA: DUF1684 domain-containing protein [Usitatibacter sp.]|nr:DUF1684 domain-containing protein [Usitatibacter sp.]
MKIRSVFLAAALAALTALPALSQQDPAYVKQVMDWRARAEQSLRRDNGWLTLAGRYVLKPGENTFGTGDKNDVVFPKGLGPAGMGSVFVEKGKVTVKLVEGLKMTSSGIEMTEKVMGTDPGNRDWVSIGRASFHFIERDGRYILRLADNQSEVRKRFGGRVWYEVDDNYRVPAKFVPYDPPRKVSIVDVIDEVSEVPVPGYVEFDLMGRPYRLDVIGDDDKGLFFVFKDATAGDTTYGSGRFLYVEEKPRAGERFLLDLNRAYNPPCAFSEFTTCPLPPKQNILKVKVEAGEKYPPKKAG